VSRLRSGVIAALVALAVVPAASAGEPSLTKSHGLTRGDALKYPATFQHLDYANPDAPKGGEMRQYATGGFDSFNPFILKGKPPDGIFLLFDSLMATPEDDVISGYGLIAESVEVPKDRSFAIFNLRPEARFHDGTPITADDVVFSLEAQRDRASPNLRVLYRDVKTVEALDAHRVKFTFGAVQQNDELLQMIGRLPILSKNYWSKGAFDHAFLETPLGSGPYRIATFEPSRYIVYQRVTDYWAKDLPIRRGLFNFDYVRYDYFSDSEAALEAFRAGVYDFRIETESKTWQTGYNFAAVQRGFVAHEAVPIKQPVGMQGFAFNLRRAKFADLRVRKAISLAFDFEWANEHLFYGEYTRNDSYFANSELAATGTPSPDELALLSPFRDELPREVFGEAYRAPRSDGPDGIRGNLLQAAKLLREAGWTIKRGRLTNDQTGEAFTIEFVLTASEFERVILPYIANLKRLGIVGRIRTVEAAQYQARLRNFDFDMVVATFPQPLTPGEGLRHYWSTAAADEPGSYNIVGIRSEAVDALIDKVVTAPDRRALIAATRALDRVLSWNIYVVPQWYLDKYWLAYWNRFGIPETRPPYGIGTESWWLDADKDAAVRRFLKQ